MRVFRVRKALDALKVDLKNLKAVLHPKTDDIDIDCDDYTYEDLCRRIHVNKFCRSALKRQLPSYLIRKDKVIDNIKYYYFVCSCGESLNCDSGDFCPKCGQKHESEKDYFSRLHNE